MRYLAVLGRQPKISLAELESLFSDVMPLGPDLATFSSNSEPNISRLGGTVKLAREITEKPEQYLLELEYSGKIVLGISDYSKNATSKKSQYLALKIKRILKSHGKNVRVLQNKSSVLSSATTFHNQLGEKPGHLELIKYGNRYFELIGVQNINSYRDRDQNRPARDAKVGMLPPKLAQILINLCGPLQFNTRILDPFCGTGVVLQEALLIGYSVYGTDASERMVEYTKRNLDWLNTIFKTHLEETTHQKSASKKEAALFTREGVSEKSIVEIGDATDFTWKQPIDAVACETYLGPPMSEPPADIKLKTVEQECRTIIVNFLKNLSTQIKSGTPVAIAVPAWLRPDGTYYHLKILDELEKLGYNVKKYNNLSQKDLLYHRDDQIVAREIIVLRKK